MGKSTTHLNISVPLSEPKPWTSNVDRPSTRGKHRSGCSLDNGQQPLIHGHFFNWPQASLTCIDSLCSHKHIEKTIQARLHDLNLSVFVGCRRCG